jgi:hypothetical protein
MGISIDPIARFENEGLISKVFNPRKAREVLEPASIEVVAKTDEGPGVRLRKAKPV